MDAICIEAASSGERADRGGRQVSQQDPVHAVGVAEVAEQAVQRMGAVEIITVGQHQRRGQAIDAAREEAEHIERRLVCPVRILHHQHGAG
jgi:hypothetical protein